MSKKGTKFLIFIVIILIIIATTCLVIYFFGNKGNNSNTTFLGTEIIGGNKESNNNEDNEIIVEEQNKKINVFNGIERPVAVMLDNHVDALPQAGLNDAYITYEMIVEGGETRLMALFKGKNLSKIGSIRSSRHYFLDYALENDAIYVHFGWSPQAQKDISKLSINNINGITAGESKKLFWRVTDKYAPHNAVTNSENIINMAKERNYSITSNKKSVLNYVSSQVMLEKGEVAESVSIPYSTSNTVKYVYNKDTGMYTRYSRGMVQTDWNTDEKIVTKNIIITFVTNTTLNDGENKGRQTLDNIGTKNGYYITNGKAIKIKCKKDSRTAQTIYEDLEGNEIKVNDGNTFIQICPINSNVTIE